MYPPLGSAASLHLPPSPPHLPPLPNPLHNSLSSGRALSLNTFSDFPASASYKVQAVSYKSQPATASVASLLLPRQHGALQVSPTHSYSSSFYPPPSLPLSPLLLSMVSGPPPNSTKQGASLATPRLSVCILGPGIEQEKTEACIEYHCELVTVMKAISNNVHNKSVTW